jgi:UDP-glucose 4-epimerase
MNKRSEINHPLKVLIIGANGFLGSHTTRFLVKKKINVNAVVRTAVSKQKLHTFSLLSPDSIFIADLTQRKKINEILKRQYDVIINYAGFSGKQSVQNDVLGSFKTNVMSALHLFDGIKKYTPQSKLILISSILQELNQESFTLYGLQKRTAFEYFNMYKKLHGLKGTTLILGNIYGPDKINSETKEYNLINNFIKQALHQKVLVVFGKGEQLRDYLFIDDFLELIWKVIRFKKEYENSYLVGYGSSTSFAEMVKKISETFRTEIIFKPWNTSFKKVEQGDVVINSENTKKTFQWQPCFSIIKGLKKTASEYKSNE